MGVIVANVGRPFDRLRAYLCRDWFWLGWSDRDWEGAASRMNREPEDLPDRIDVDPAPTALEEKGFRPHNRMENGIPSPQMDSGFFVFGTKGRE